MRIPKIAASLVVSVSVFAILLGIYLVVVRPNQIHDKWFDAVNYRILQLAEKRPDGVSREQWASCILMTWNLNWNCGALPTWFQPSARDPFLAEFDRRLQGKVDIGTIDWIWDQYCLYSTRGFSYSRVYRPTTPESLVPAEAKAVGEYNLDVWLERLERRRKRGVH